MSLLPCTPARGNEKGRVERQVAIDRQQFFTPIPKGNNLQEINDLLVSQLIHYNNTHKHPKQNKTIDEVFESERQFLMAAPVLFERLLHNPQIKFLERRFVLIFL